MRSPPPHREEPAIGEAASGEVTPERDAGLSGAAEAEGAAWPQTEYKGMSAWVAAAGAANARGVAPAGGGARGLDTCLSAPTAANAASDPGLEGADARGSEIDPEGGDSGSGDFTSGLRAGSKSSMEGRKGAAAPEGSGRPAVFGFGAALAWGPPGAGPIMLGGGLVEPGQRGASKAGRAMGEAGMGPAGRSNGGWRKRQVAYLQRPRTQSLHGLAWPQAQASHSRFLVPQLQSQSP